MDKFFKTILVVGVAALLSFVFGCKNPDNTVNPQVPSPQGPGPTVPTDPYIPEPFAFNFGTILDIAIEGDGDIVFSSESGLHLFTPYGTYKRTLSSIPFVGLVTSNYSVLDTGRGIMGVSGEVNDCRPTPSYDDLYVTGGVPHVTYDPAWWDGEPDPYYPEICIDIASTSNFASCDMIPHPIAYHPHTAFAYQKVFAPDCVADSDCPWPIGNVVPYGGYGILAYHPDAPLPPDYMSMIFEGGQDFLVYYDFPVYYQEQILAAMVYGVVPACQLHNLFIVWDWTSMNYMLTRSNMEAQYIGDFEFDSLGRLIMVLPNADSVAITDPVIFGQPIAIQQVIGGRQNGMGTLPGEFQGPRAVAIDPRNQNILISDTGNRRIQIFTPDGKFIREIMSNTLSPFAPGALRVDAFGAIYVANVDPNRAEGDDLRIFNEYGAPVIYGTIEGWVYDKSNHQPIDNARVHVASTFAPLDVFTDKDGHFLFPAVAAGTHSLTASKYGYNSAQVNVTVTGGYKTLVDFYLERQMTQPPGYGTVTGTVMSTMYNEPVPGLTAEIVGLGISNQTNGNGEFTLYTVPEGEHIFRLSRNGVIYYESYITVTKGGILDLGILYLPIP